MALKKYVHHVAAIFIFFTLLYFGATIQEDASRMLLKPYSKLAEIFFNTSHRYVLNIGYVEIHNKYIIGQNCLGINFTALLFVVCAVPFFKHLNGLHKTFWLFSCFLGSIFLGFAVNSIRIIGSIPFALHEKFNLIHASLGVVLYLSVLTFFYAALLRIFEGKSIG